MSRPSSGLSDKKTDRSSTSKQPQRGGGKGKKRIEKKQQKALAEFSSDGILSFIDDTIQDSQGNMISVDAGSEFSKDLAPKKKALKSGGFQSMDLIPEVFQGIMKLGFKVPTPIQRKSIPPLLEGNDVVAMARTGSGKTAAFAIPLLHRLAQNKKPGGVMRAAGVRAVVLSPTRELVQQTYKVISQLGRFLDFRIIMLIGGQSMNTQFELLSNTPDILVATPGRLVHHLLEVKFSLLHVEFCCFDEADRLFEMGFAQQLYEIIKRMGDTRQTCLFSATMPTALIEFSRAGLKNPLTIRLDSESKLSPDLTVSFFLLRTRDKVAALLYTLNKVIPANEQCLVFVSTRHHVDFLVGLLRADGIPVAGVYGQMDSEARADSIYQFKRKEIRVMVVTDVAARGIDIPLLDNVLNYDFPCQPKLFIHRAGRVARNGRIGSCHSFVCPDEMPFLIDLYLFFAWKMPLLEGAAQTDRVLTASGALTKVDDDKNKLTNSGTSKQQHTSSKKGNTNMNDQGEEYEHDNADNADSSDDDNNNTNNTNGSSSSSLSSLSSQKAQGVRAIQIGKFPTTLLDREAEHAQFVINTNDLSRLQIGSDRAYKKYVSIRPVASKASARRWKELRVPDIHPFFTSLADSTSGNHSSTDAWKSMQSVIESEKLIEEIANFTPDQTIFELYHRDVDLIRQKRYEHDKIIQNRIIDAKNRAMSMNMESGVHMDEHDNDDDLANTPGDDKLVPKIQPKTIRVKRKLTTVKQHIITAADRRKVKKYQEQLKLGKITQEQYDHLVGELNQEQKTRAKILHKELVNSGLAAPTSNDPHNDDDDQDDLGLNIEDQTITRKRRRGALSSDEMRDRHYISLVPTGKNVFEELGMSINNLESIGLQLHGDDDDTVLKAKKVEKWNERKKKFITVYESKDAFGKLVTNESGKKVSKDYVPGQLYDKWRRQSRHADVVAEFDDDESTNTTNSDMNPKQRAAQERRRLRGLKTIAETHRQAQSSDHRIRSSGGLDTGLKSKHEILKQRQETLKNRERHNRGMAKAGAKGKGKGKGKGKPKRG